ncbi:MAG: FAD-dependent oxidoreductase [Saprospiraceae bacterium]|nr:FAD-dependent oxidoreductase [Candidatus Vicinibacter affinis]MBK7696730.1 FAD-dependent oxidoreductase [Candidatus Vicinibacter affinis]MBK8405516.1 FAD-dependent oxidoreductase [Candidatus Vicinibacter affinis]MBK8643257.1 FAD-dependent oxidoreductase [Candidatus Vicinibacter affinis]MBK9641372.1 FAD-dependent oxidoreductase [Candidatus Vicinibacter affinis]
MLWHEAEFIGQKMESSTTRRFWFKIKSEQVLQYDAGQFFTFDLPLGQKRAERWRSYSIANACDGSNMFELCISYKKNGLASKYFFEDINKGDVLKFKGPDGGFVLPKDNNHSLMMICTGAGVVPFRSMIQDVEKNKLKYKSIHLIFGVRKEKDILYYEEIIDWCKYLENFKASICLSRETKLPTNTDNLTFYNGYVHPVYLNEKYQSPKDNLFMICGWTEIIDETVLHLLNELKVDRTQIKYELFG